MENFNFDQAINYAFRLLGYRMRTVAGISERLIKKGYSQETAALVVERLKELGYLNDFNYVESYVRSNPKPKSRRRLAYELLNKGVDKETIESALMTRYSPEDELKAAKLLAEKLWSQENNKKIKFEPEKKQEKLKTFHKIAQNMLNRGFSHTIVKQVLQEIKTRLGETD